MKSRNVKILGLILVIVIVGTIIGYLLIPKEILLKFGQLMTGHAETPYGESLDIELNVGGQTSGQGSWYAAYEDSESQNVYEVNGTYKSQEQVTLSYSLSVTYSSCSSIKNVNTTITAFDDLDQSNFKYQLATDKSLSGTSPISDNGETSKTISQHLTDCEASSTDATIVYKVYCKVTAVGTVSGTTLTAEIPVTQFTALHYVRSSEETGASVTPQVSVASWTEIVQKPEMLAIIALIIAAIALAVWPRKPKQ